MLAVPPPMAAAAACSAAVLEAQQSLARGNEAGKKKEAATALKNLSDLLTSGMEHRQHASTLCTNRLRALQGLGDASAPTWDSVFARVLYYLSVLDKLKKPDGEKLRLLVGAAISSGADAIAAKTELKVFCYVWSEVSNSERTPVVADNKSAHPECVAILLQLTSSRPQLLARLAPARLHDLLDRCICWISGDPDTEPRGPDKSIARLPQLMVQYAQLLHHLVAAWVADMPVGDTESEGPFAALLRFISDVCAHHPPYYTKMANLLWSAVLQAIVVHGANAVHEVAAFGLEAPVRAAVISEWNAERGTALADTLASFVRVHLACVRACGLHLPKAYARQLSRLATDEITRAPAFKRPGRLLNVCDTREETWRARALLQLFTDVLAIHKPPAAGAGASTDAADAAVAKRPKVVASLPLRQQLHEHLVAPSASAAGEADVRQRWLLLLGSVCERHPCVLAPPDRAALLGALASQLPTAEASINDWGKMPPIAWSLGNLAAIAPARTPSADWGTVWAALHKLVVVHALPMLAAVAGGVHRAHDSVSGVGGGDAPTGWERACFVDLASRCMRIILTRQLLLPDTLAAAFRALHTSPLFALSAALDGGGDGEAHNGYHASQDATGLSAEAGRTHLLSVVELAHALSDAANRARTTNAVALSDHGQHGGGDDDGWRVRLVHWLCSGLQGRLLQAAFESTTPFQCALQLHAQRAAAATGAEHGLIRGALCRVAVARTSSRSMPQSTSFLTNPASWRPYFHSDGSGTAPPMPAAWRQRLAPPALGAAVDEASGERPEWQVGAEGFSASLPPGLLSPGLLQLEIFLRHVESLGSRTAASSDATGHAPDGSELVDGSGDAIREVTRMAASADPGLNERDEMVDVTVRSLKDQLRSAVMRCPAEAGEGEEAAVLRSATHALRIAEWTASLMLNTGLAASPSSAAKLVRRAMEHATKWIASVLASPVIEYMAAADVAAKAMVWVRAHRTLLALRGCLLSLASLAVDAAPSWLETLYATLLSESHVLVQGATLLCGMLARRTHGVTTTGDPATTAGDHGNAGPSSATWIDTLGATWHGGVQEEVGMDLDHHGNASSHISGSAISGGGYHEGADGSLARMDADCTATLHVVLECIDAWARAGAQFDPTLFADLPSALESIHCAPLRTHVLALRILSRRIRAAPELRGALRAPMPPVSEGDNAGISDTVHELLKPWGTMLHALLVDAKRRLATSTKRVRKIKVEAQGMDGEAGVGGSIAWGAACCDYNLRRALAALTEFANDAPAVLPLGGSAHELRAYNELWMLIVGSEDSDPAKAVVGERGGHGGVVRDVHRILPLTPAARLALADALYAHVSMHARLHDALRASEDSTSPQLTFVDGTAFEHLLPLGDAMGLLLEALHDGQWAVRDVAVRSLAIYVRTSFDEDHEDLLCEFLVGLLNLPTDDRLPISELLRRAILAFQHGGGASGFGDTSSALDATAIAPKAYVSPAFEKRVSALHAIQIIAQSSPICLDTALLMIMLAHGPDASRVAPATTVPPPGASGSNDDEEPPPRAQLTSAAAAAMSMIASAKGQSISGLLRRRAPQLLTLWLQRDLPLLRLPCGLFGTSGSTADEVLRTFLWEYRVPLATAATMASTNGEVLSNAASMLGLAGGVCDLLLDALPHVVARLLGMHGSDDSAERETVTCGIELLSRMLAPQPLHVCITPALADVVTEVLLYTTSANPPTPPKRSVARVVSVLNAARDTRGVSAAVVSDVPLADILRKLPPLRVVLLVLQLREAMDAGEAELAAFEVLIGQEMLTTSQLGEGCTALIMQAALLSAARSSLGRTEHASACGLLKTLHQRLENMPSVRAALLPALLRALVPIATHSVPAQSLLKQLFAPRSGGAEQGGDGGNAEQGGDDGNNEPGGGGGDALSVALQTTAHYDAVLPMGVPGLRELQARLDEARASSRSVVKDLLACEGAAPAHLLGAYPSTATPDMHSVSSLSRHAVDRDASCVSDLEARAAVTRVIEILGDPGVLQDASLGKWYEDGKEEAEDELSGSRMQDDGEDGLGEDEEAARALDDQSALESGGQAWCAWNDPSFESAATHELRSPLERVRRWLLRLASAPSVSKPLATLIGQALGFSAFQSHGGTHRVKLPPTIADPTMDMEESDTGPTVTGRHARLLRQVHAVLVSSDAPHHLCSTAARVLITMMSEDERAPNSPRRAAARALDEIRRLAWPHAASAYYHLVPFADAKEVLADQRKGWCTPPAGGAVGSGHANAAIPADATIWAACGSGQYDHPHWLVSVVAPLLQAASDPLLASCAPLAAAAPRFAASVFDEAVMDVAAQAAHGAALAAAIHAALIPRSGSCPATKAAVILRTCTSFLCARNCLNIHRTPELPLTSAQPMWSTPFWSTLDLVGLAEVAAEHQMHQSSLYLLEGHHARLSASGNLVSPVAAPRTTAGAEGGHDRVRQAALLSRTLPNLPVKDAADGMRSMADAMEAGSTISNQLSMYALGNHPSHPLALALSGAQAGLRNTSPTSVAPSAPGRPRRVVTTESGVAAVRLADTTCSHVHVFQTAGTDRNLGALDEMHTFGCFALMHSLAGQDHGSSDESVAEKYHESAWRLGRWSANHGANEHAKPWGHERLHAALSSTLPLVGSTDDSACAAMRRKLGRVEQHLALEACVTHPEELSKLESSLFKLQLCCTLHELSGALLDDLHTDGRLSAPWLLSKEEVRHAAAIGSRRGDSGTGGLSESVGGGTPAQGGRDSLRKWAECQGRRLDQQQQMLSGFKEPLLAFHGALLQRVQPLGSSEYLDLTVQAVQAARLLGDLESARNLTRHAAETCGAQLAAYDAAGVGIAERSASSRDCAGHHLTAWVCLWEEAKLQWPIGGENCADALLMARRLRESLHTSDSASPVASGQLHWEVLCELGGWVDALRCESRGEIESEFLGRAVKLSEASGDCAVADALFALARFHERQFVALRDELRSSSFAKSASVTARTAEELQRTRQELLQLGTGSQDGKSKDGKRRKVLEAHERELTIKIALDEGESAATRECQEHLTAALDTYVSCLRRATSSSQTSRAAASAIVRLWSGNREHAQLSTHIERELRTGLATRVVDFVPLAFQLTARLASVADADGHPMDTDHTEESLSQGSHVGPTQRSASGASQMDHPYMASGEVGGASTGAVGGRDAAVAFQHALSALLLELAAQENDGQLVLHQLIAEIGGSAPDPAAAGGFSPAGGSEGLPLGVQPGKRHAARALLQRVRARAESPAPIDAAIALSDALRTLAHCPNPASTPEGGGRVAMHDALAAAGIGAAHDPSRVHEHGFRVDLLSVPPALPPAVCEGNFLQRYLPMYVALPSGVPANVASARAAHAGYAKLIWCEDEAGSRHALVLKTGAAGTLDTRRDALVQQVVDELNRCLHDEPQARQRALKVRGRRALPLSPSVGLYEWRAHAVGLHTFLAHQHTAAYREGRERLDMGSVEAELVAAHAADAHQGRPLSASAAHTPVGGEVAEASSAPRIGPAIRSAWARVLSGTSPLLHRFVLTGAPSVDAWLARRMQLSRSLAASSMLGWVLGLGGRCMSHEESNPSHRLPCLKDLPSNLSREQPLIASFLTGPRARSCTSARRRSSSKTPRAPPRPLSAQPLPQCRHHHFVSQGSSSTRWDPPESTGPSDALRRCACGRRRGSRRARRSSRSSRSLLTNR